METNKNEDFLGELAKAYANKENTVLLDEWAALDAESKLLPASEPARKTKYSTFMQKFGRRRLQLASLAASLVLVLLLANGYRAAQQHSAANTPAHSSPPASSASGGAASGGAASGGTASGGAAPTDTAPAGSSPSGSAPVETAPASSAPVGTAPATSAPAAPMPPAPDTTDELRHSVQLVRTSLPAGYSLDGIDYDNAAAVMGITNERGNHIVLTVEKYYVFETEGFSVITLNGSTAWALVKNDYCVLRYAGEGIVYTCTSMYGYEDLIEISRELI